MRLHDIGAMTTAGLVVFLVSSTAQAADYYVCDCGTDADGDCQAGNDGSSGTDAESAWQTYEKARTEFASIGAGDSILLCQGGAFSAGMGRRWVNPSCEAQNPCTVGTYEPGWGSGDEDRPIVWATGGHGFALEDGGDAEHEEGYVFENLILRTTDPSGNGFFIYNDIDDVTIRNFEIDGFNIGVHLAGSNPCGGPACDGQNQRITLEGSRIVNSESQGWLGSSSGSQILDSEFQNNGSEAIYDHNIYVSGSAGEQTQGIRVIGNRLYQSTLDGNGTCTAVSLVVHGDHDDLVIADNEVWEDVGQATPGCWGIAIDNGYDSAESFTNVVIRGNTVRNVGNVAIGVGATADAIIENNVIISEQDFGVTAIAAPDRDPGPGDLEQDNIVVRNNSIYFGAAASGTGVAVRSMGDGHAIVNNAIHYAGTGTFRCLRADLDPSAYDDVDHNLCHYPDTQSGEWADGYGDLAAWQSQTGFGASSMAIDPEFADVAGYNLSAAAEDGPMVDVGHPTMSAPTAMGGGQRDANPDIGAHEWGVGGGTDTDGTGTGTDSGGDTDGDSGSATAGDASGTSAGTGTDGTGASDDGAGSGDGGGCGCRSQGTAGSALLFLLPLLSRRRSAWPR